LLSPQLKRTNLGAEFDGIHGIVRKIASDEAEVDSAELDSFISAQIILSDQLATKLGDRAIDDSRDAGHDTAAGERKLLFYFGT
jgi:hypothetical protein